MLRLQSALSTSLSFLSVFFVAACGHKSRSPGPGVRPAIQETPRPRDQVAKFDGYASCEATDLGVTNCRLTKNELLPKQDQLSRFRLRVLPSCPGVSLSQVLSVATEEQAVSLTIGGTEEFELVAYGFGPLQIRSKEKVLAGLILPGTCDLKLVSVMAEPVSP